VSAARTPLLIRHLMVPGDSFTFILCIIPVPSGFAAGFKFTESAFGIRPCMGKLSRRFGNRDVSGNVEKSFPKVHSDLYVHVASPQCVLSTPPISISYIALP